jgi:hypothetical protein
VEAGSTASNRGFYNDIPRAFRAAERHAWRREGQKGLCLSPALGQAPLLSICLLKFVTHRQRWLALPHLLIPQSVSIT